MMMIIMSGCIKFEGWNDGVCVLLNFTEDNEVTIDRALQFRNQDLIGDKLVVRYWDFNGMIESALNLLIN